MVTKIGKKSIYLVILMLMMPISLITPAKAETPRKPGYGPEWDKIVAAAKIEGEINAYGYGFTGDKGKRLEETFGKKYGIKINPTSAMSAQLCERVKTESAMGKVVADLMNVVLDAEFELVLAGLTEEIASKLPELSVTAKNEWYYYPATPEGHIITPDKSVHGLVINQDLVRPKDEPTSWYDLLDPKWDGKIVMGSPTLSGEAYRLWLFADKLGIADPEGYYRKLAKNHPVVESNLFKAGERLAAGDFAINFINYSGWAGPLKLAGVPLKIANTKEGLVTLPGSSLILVKGRSASQCGLGFHQLGSH